PNPASRVAPGPHGALPRLEPPQLRDQPHVVRPRRAREMDRRAVLPDPVDFLRRVEQGAAAGSSGPAPAPGPAPFQPRGQAPEIRLEGCQPVVESLPGGARDGAEM